MQIRRSRLTRGRNLFRFAHTYTPLYYSHISYITHILHITLSLFPLCAHYFLCLSQRSEYFQTVLGAGICYYAKHQQHFLRERDPEKRARCMQITSIKKRDDGKEKFISLYLRASQCVMKLLTGPIHRVSKSLHRESTNGQRLKLPPFLLFSSRV